MLKSHPWTAVLIVIAVSTLAYLPLIDKLGLYFGDVTFMWIEQGLDAASLIPAISDDRPGAGVMFALTGALLGANVTAWHALMLLLRVGAALALIWGLRAVFPNNPGLTTAAGALIAVYPGFLAQSMAINLQNYLAAHVLALVSIGATLHAINSRRPLILVGLSILSLIGYLLLLEAFVGMEALRLLLLWFHPSAPLKLRARFQWTVRQLIPVIIAVAAFGVWRIFIFDDDLRSDTNIDYVLSRYREGVSFRTLLYWLRTSILHSSVLAWMQPLYERAAYITLPMVIPTAAAAILIGALRLPADRAAACRLVLIGALSMVSALTLLSLLLKRPSLDAYASRLMLPADAGAVLLVIGAVALLPQFIRRFVISALISIGVLTQLADAALYTDRWAMQRDLWRQMRVRVPALEDDTTVIVALPERWRNFPYITPFDEIFFPFNWMLTGSAGELRYGGLNLSERLITPLKAGEMVDLSVRSGYVSYQADLSRAVVIWLPETGVCLRVLSPSDTNLTDPLLAAAAPFSRPELIITDAPPPDLPAWLGESADNGECLSG